MSFTVSFVSHPPQAPRPRRRRRPADRGRWLRRAVGAVVLAAWAVLFAPAALGGSAGYVVVVGQSMEPTLRSGDLVVTRSASEYAPGDVVAFESGSGLVIHRIVGGSAEEGFVMQGDNRSTADIWRPTPEEIVGRSWLRIPSGGRAMTMVRSPLLFAGVAGVFAFLAVVREEDEEEAEDAPGPP